MSQKGVNFKIYFWQYICYILKGGKKPLMKCLLFKTIIINGY